MSSFKATLVSVLLFSPFFANAADLTNLRIFEVNKDISLDGKDIIVIKARLIDRRYKTGLRTFIVESNGPRINFDLDSALLALNSGYKKGYNFTVEFNSVREQNKSAVKYVTSFGFDDRHAYDNHNIDDRYQQFRSYNQHTKENDSMNIYDEDHH